MLASKSYAVEAVTAKLRSGTVNGLNVYDEAFITESVLKAITAPHLGTMTLREAIESAFDEDRSRLAACATQYEDCDEEAIRFSILMNGIEPEFYTVVYNIMARTVNRVEDRVDVDTLGEDLQDAADLFDADSTYFDIEDTALEIAFASLENN